MVENGCICEDCCAAKRPQIQGDSQTCLEALLIDQQIDRALQRDRHAEVKSDVTAAGNTEHGRIQLLVDKLTGDNIVVFVELDRPHSLRLIGGIDLQQHEAADADRPQVHDGLTRRPDLD